MTPATARAVIALFQDLEGQIFWLRVSVILLASVLLLHGVAHLFWDRRK